MPDDNGALRSCERARTTELAIGQRELPEDDLRAAMAHYTNIARQPHLYSDIDDKPRRALAGDPLYQWVSKRVGCAAWMVKAWYVGL